MQAYVSEKRTDIIDEVIYRQQGGSSHGVEVFSSIFDGVRALNVLGRRLENSFCKMLGVWHRV